MHNPAMRSLGTMLILLLCLLAVVSASSPFHFCCTQTCEDDGPAGCCNDNCVERACCAGIPIALPQPILLLASLDVARLDSSELPSAMTSADLREIFHVPRSLLA